MSEREPPTGRAWLIWLAFVLGASIVAYGAFVARGHARNLGQWDGTDPAVRAWYQGLMQPDNPTVSCCGEADAYWCDNYFARNGKAYCRITDDRPDEPRGRPHVEIGTEIEIPDAKLKWDRGNPTGHSIVFLSRSGFVFCFVQGGGA